MDPTWKDSLLWGLVGAMSFLVLVQGYHLATGEFIGWLWMSAIALLVLLVSASATHALRPRIAAWNERP